MVAVAEVLPAEECKECRPYPVPCHREYLASRVLVCLAIPLMAGLRVVPSVAGEVWPIVVPSNHTWGAVLRAVAWVRLACPVEIGRAHV